MTGPEACASGEGWASDNRPPQRRESELRDYIAANLDLIESGLTLVDTEYQLKNTDGADGFIDILAREESGDLVVVELKRSDKTARQALHELEKYVALLAKDRGIRVDRLRCVLISTAWHELLVPFTHFERHSDFHVEGRVLHLASDGFPMRTDHVVLPSLDSGLEICPIHLNLLFSGESARDAASASAAEILSNLLIDDYILINLKYVGNDLRIIHPYACYVAFAEFPQALREHFRNQFPDDFEDEFDYGLYWHEQLAQRAIVDGASANEVSASGPDRFGALDGWDVQVATGYGRFAERKVWTEDALARAVSAEGESFSVPFERQVKVRNKAAWARMRGNLAYILKGAGQWPDLVAALLDEVERASDGEVRVHAYVPNDVLFGLRHLIRTGSADYLPQLWLRWENSKRKAVVGGVLNWDGQTKVTTPQQTLGSVFGDFLSYMVTRATGSLWQFETRLCELHGLRYDLKEFVEGSDTLTRLKLSERGNLIRSPVREDEPTALQFVDAHSGYLVALAEMFEESSMGLPS